VAVERGQATVETAALWGLVAVLLLIVAALLGPGLADSIVGALASHLPHARSESRSTPDERALRNPRLRALIDRALPRLVLERDPSGDDDEDLYNEDASPSPPPPPRTAAASLSLLSPPSSSAHPR